MKVGGKNDVKYCLNGDTVSEWMSFNVKRMVALAKTFPPLGSWICLFFV